MTLKDELREFLQQKGVTPLFYPTIRGSKIVEFIVRTKKEEEVVNSLLNNTHKNSNHRLTFGTTRYGAYCCNFQPLRLWTKQYLME